jgi:hypothetical protein
LFFGRNEENGLRCVYHGWKFDVDGQCVDMPNPRCGGVDSPAESNFRDKIQHTAYPAIEAGGVVWVYMGEQRPTPALPGLEWIDVPPEQRFTAKRMQYCNWVQAVEGEVDQSHVSFLHRQLTSGSVTGRPNVDRIRTLDTHPRFSAVDTDYGVLIGAARDAGDGTDYWRITQFLLPFWSMTGPYGENPSRQTRAWVPMDDENVMVFSVTFHPLRPLEEHEIARMRAGSGAGYVGEANFLPPTSVPGGAWRPEARASNDYLVDRARQKTDLYSGIPEFWAQDAAMQESMGPIYDRSGEHLGTSDLGIIRVRQRLLREVKNLEALGGPPAGVQRPAVYQVRGAAALLPRNADWIQATGELRRVIAGLNPAGV